MRDNLEQKNSKYGHVSRGASNKNKIKQIYNLDIFSQLTQKHNPVPIYLLKVNSRHTRTRFEICSKLTIKAPERRHWRCSGVFIVNFEHLTLCFSVPIVNFKHVNADWEVKSLK